MRFAFWTAERKQPKTVKRSSMTMGEAIERARKAGRLTPDTGLFDEWLEAAGLLTRGAILVARLRREYEAGFEERFQVRVSVPAAGLCLPSAEESRRMNQKFVERMKKQSPAAAPVEYKGFVLSQDAEGWHYSGEVESTFDTLRDVKRFVDSL